ncbi:MAG: 2-oxo acid dehydrogenase subunit E2 [Candidatus Marinimicrobia bacterium]|nr:2-oxo acid dehydrogenase subunit E2 [Candidatus Neomarinimicrobiota bacterium]MCF7902674.1 2-oxo acid dehydrogenase subunit E2 [Candidatus Neomarinimicrobiota bacterium]
MLINIEMPKMGESLTEGTVLEWKVKVGDTIEKDDVLLEIATDKVDSEIPSPVTGKVVEILGEVNQTYEVGTVIARIETDADAATSAETKVDSAEIEPTKQEPPKPETHPAPTPAPGPAPASQPVSDNRFYSPVVRKIAHAENISAAELAQIPGTGKKGRVTKKDIEHYIKTRDTHQQAAPAATSIEREALPSTGLADQSAASADIVEMDNMRRRIAQHMRHSLDTAAHVYTVSECDMSRIKNFIARNGESFKSKHGHSLTVTHFITYAVRDALVKFPLVNASLDGTQIIKHRNVNIGIAVAVKDGLVVPPVRNAEDLNLIGISKAVSEIVRKSRNKQLMPDDLQGATFSITNFGVFGSLAGYPIINQPNVAILGVGAIKKRPVVVEIDGTDAIAIRQICHLTLGFDHRLIDGAMGSSFLETVVENLENFELDGIV